MAKHYVCCFLLAFAICTLSTAQTCCSGGVPLSNNLGLPNEGSNSLILGLAYDYNNLNTLNTGRSELNDDSRLRITNSVLFNVGYAITDRFAVETLFTWVNQTRTITQFENENFTETRGLGDAIALAKYNFPKIWGQSSTLEFGLGVKAPLGKANLTNEQGIILTADLQPGSGAWDTLLFMAFSKALGFRPSGILSLITTVRFTGENNDYLNGRSVYEFGNELQVNLGYTDQFLMFNTIMNPGLILKYRKVDFDRIDGSDLPNTGGEWLFLRPELTINLGANLRGLSRLEVPVYSFVEGTQLTPTLRFTTGLNLLLKQKNKGIRID